MVYRSTKLIDSYQGRLYIENKRQAFIGLSFDYNAMEELLSVPFEKYMANPEYIKNNYPIFADFFERIAL